MMLFMLMVMIMISDDRLDVNNIIMMLTTKKSKRLPKYVYLCFEDRIFSNRLHAMYLKLPTNNAQYDDYKQPS